MRPKFIVRWVNIALVELLTTQSGGQRFALGLLLAGLFFGAGVLLQAETYVNRVGPGGAVQDVVLQNANWIATGSPYILEAHVTVEAGAALTVEPGVTVQVNAGKVLHVDGALTANLATFTINGAGNWLGIYFAPTASASVLNGCTVDRAGLYNMGWINGGYRSTAIYVDQCSPTVMNCTISDSAGQGIEVYSGQPTIQNNTFHNLPDSAYAIYLDHINTFPVTSGNSATGTGIGGIAVPSGTISGTNRWNKAGANFPYYFGDVTIAEDARLTVDPGVTARTDGGIVWVAGTLIVQGTAGNPVTFTSRKAAPAAGDWRAVYYGPKAGQSTASYFKVEYAGRYNLGWIHNAYRSAAIYVDSCNLPFDNLTISDSAGHGLQLWQSSSRITGALIERSAYLGLAAETESRPEIRDTAFRGNGTSGYYTLGMDATCVPNPFNVRFETNKMPGIQIWGGTLSSNALWKNWSTNVAYVLTENVTVSDGTRLEIQAGAVVKAAERTLYINGTLIATNTVFTSWRDDAADANADSNGDGASTTPEPGNWQGIYLSPNSGDSILEQCVIRYAGRYHMGWINSAYRQTALYVNGCSPILFKTTFAKSGLHGLELFSSAAKVINCAFNDFGSGGYAIVFNTLDKFPTLSGNTVSGTGHLGIAVPGGDLARLVRWNRPGDDFPYFLNGELNAPEGGAFTLDAGVTLKCDGALVRVYGTLLAQGTASAPVVFTSRKAAPAAGDWRGVYFGPQAGASVASYFRVEYAGRYHMGWINNSYRETAIYLDGCSPQFSHLAVTDSGGHGVETWQSNSRITDVEFARCGFYGLKTESQSRPEVRNAIFRGNGGRDTYTVGMDASCVVNALNLQFETNKYQGIQLWGGTLTASGVWRNWGTNAPYVLTENVTVADGVRLEIEPGTIVKNAARTLYVNGTLLATNVTFTSWRDDALDAGADSNGDGTNTVAAPGDWKGIYLGPAAGNSVLEHCQVRYAGQYHLGWFNNGYRAIPIYVDNCSPVISACTIAYTATSGIELFGSSAILRGNRFHNIPDGQFAIVCDDLSQFPAMNDNSAAGTGYLGLYIPSGSISVNARWNKPGTNFPYFVWNDLSVDAGASLKIDAGVTVKPRTGGFFINGTMQALGSPAQRITFTSFAEPAVPASWSGLYFGPEAGNSIMSYCTVAGAGRYHMGWINNEYQQTSIYVNGCSPVFSGLVLSQSGGYGLSLYGASPTVCNSLVYSNAWGNFRIYGGSTALVVNNTITRSASVGIYCPGASPLLANNIIAFNDGNGVKVEGSGSPIMQYNDNFGNTLPDYVGIAAGTNDLAADPQFVDRAAGDYHLSAASPGLNRGNNAATQPSWTDLEGRLRIFGAAVDLGAYESGSALAVRTVDGMVRVPADAGFTGENVFEIAGQSKSQSVLAGQPAIYYAKVKYLGNLPDKLIVSANGAAKGWTLRVFNSATGSNDITSVITQPNGWIITNANPGAVYELRLEVTPDATVAGHAAQEILLSAQSFGDGLMRDTVRAITVNQPRYQPDLAISRLADVRYVGDNLVNSTGQGQTKSLEVETNETAVYFIRVNNRGNMPDALIIRGDSGGSAWNVRYFDGLNSTNDITAAVASAGWSCPSLSMGSSLELRLEVVGLSHTAGATVSLAITATSPGDAGKLDVVKAVTTLVPAAVTPQGGTYTLDADFEKGSLIGVEYQTVHDQLQLTKEAIALPFIWVPNSNEGTVSKVDTRTGRELGRYRTGPPGRNSNPSRTTVDLQGNCWVANRYIGTAVKIGLYENGQYEDRNGNGLIETSQDKNGDGVITGDEVLDWGKDECVLREVVLISGLEGTYTPGTFGGTYASDDWNPGPRGVAVDGLGNVWLSPYASKKFYYVEGKSGKILRTNDVSSVNHTSYGAVVDANGIVWSAGQDKRHVLRMDPKDNTFTVIDIGHFVYGLGLDRNNHLFVSGWQDSKLSRINTLTGVKEWTVQGIYESRGIAVTDDGDVWVANSAPGTVARWSNNGILKATISVGNQPTGVAVDSEGKVWAVNFGEDTVVRINPNNNAVELIKHLPGTAHYGYSDMTGIISRNATTRSGKWTVVHSAGVKDTPWGTVSWHASQPAGASISVRARSSNDRLNWSLWENANNGVPLHATPSGKYLEVEANFQALASEISPILYDLTLAPSGKPTGGQQVYYTDFQTGVDSAWSMTNTTTTPNGPRKILGQFGNTNLTLTLSNLPPHSAVIVNFDLLVIGTWDGNNASDGPDLMEVNVAGGLKLLKASFNNGPASSLEDGQSYPDSFGGGKYPARSGAAETNTLGFNIPGTGVMDSVYTLGYTFNHTADKLVLNFIGSGLAADIAQEAWGLDNVRVNVIPLSAPPYLKAMGKPQNGRFHLQLMADVGLNIDILSSTNLTQWDIILSTNTTLTNIVECVDENAGAHQKRFYKAAQKP